MYQNYKLGIVVPAYNEALLIGDTLRNMPKFADRVYVIDDASTDSTAQITKGFVNGQICTFNTKPLILLLNFFKHLFSHE